MGKTFVEDERPCDSCVNVTRYGCVSWNCEYINRDEAIKAWREKHETADRKTKNSSEKPNNCEVKNYCDDCLYTDTCDDKAFFYACTSKATISKMEQVEDEPQMREATAEERQAVRDYIESISEETGVMFYGKDEPRAERSE